MKLFLLGRRASVTGWLEEAASAFRAEGHEVRVGVVREPWLHPGLQRALTGPIADSIAVRIRSFEPDLVLAIGGYHVPAAVLERIAALPAPVAGWVGDNFGEEAAELAAFYDLVAYTDSGLIARHADLKFPARTLFAPHAVDPHTAAPEAERAAKMVFVANPTPGRRSVVEGISTPMTLYGAGWTSGVDHEVHPRRVRPAALPGLYAGHLASLNIRNEFNVFIGLNQRSFQPYLASTPVVSDDQQDLAMCFDPGAEVFVWRDIEALNDIYARLVRFPDEAAAVGEQGRRRVLADHTYGARLAAIAAQI